LRERRIRQLFLNVQVDRLFDSKTKMRFALVFAIASKAIKLYKLMDVPVRRLTYIFGAFLKNEIPILWDLVSFDGLSWEKSLFEYHMLAKEK